MMTAARAAFRCSRTGLAILLGALLHGSPLAAQFSPEARGRVVDAATGLPVAGADVRLDTGDAARTGADGRFLLRLSAPGEQPVRIRAIGYAPQVVQLRLQNGITLQLDVALQPLAIRLDDLTARAETLGVAGAITIERAELQARGARDVADALNGIPGVVITRRGGPGAPATISIRGSSADQVLVLLDGIPVNAALSGEADLSTLPAAGIARITVLPGAQSARYGPQALGGVLLIETEAADAAAGAELSIDAGAFGDRGADGRVRVGRADGWRAQATLAHRRTDNAFDFTLPEIRGGGSAVRLNADVARTLGAIAVARSDARGSLQLRADITGVQRGLPGSIVQQSRFARQRDRRTGLGATLARTVGAWQLDADLTAQRQQLAFADSAPPLRAAYDDTSSVTALLGRTTLSRVAGPWRLRISGDARTLGIRSTTFEASSTPASLRYGALGGGLSRLWPLGGVRVGIGLDARADVGTLIDGVILSPRGSVQLERGNAVLSFSYGAGFAPPTPGDLFFRDGVQVSPNPLLRPERVRNDLTGTLDLRDLALGPVRTSLTVAAFRADIDDMILWSPNFRFVWSPANFDVTRHGAEAAVKLQHTGLGRLSMGGAYTAVAYAGPVLAGQVIYRPAWSGHAELESRVADVDALLALRWTGIRRTVVGSALNQLPPFALVDLRASRTVTFAGRPLRVRAALENLFDQRAGMLFDFPNPGRSWTVGVSLTTAGPTAPR